MPTIRVAYADTETTGLSSYSDRIVEIGIVLAEVDWGTGRILRIIDEYQSLHDPGIRIPGYATAIHGITNEMVKGRRIDTRKVRELLAAADICLAHNSGFDKGFVAQVVPEAPGYLWGCTCRGIPWKTLITVDGTSLQTLATHFRMIQVNAHRAMDDVLMTMTLVDQPGVVGGRAFQQILLHKKVRRHDLASDIVIEANSKFCRRPLSKRRDYLPTPGIWPMASFQ